MRAHAVLIFVGSLLLSASMAQGIGAGQLDDFQIGGNVANWGGGNPILSPLPSQIPNGGPVGLGDGYLQISVEDFHLGTTNTAAQWAGDYLAAGVTAIDMDANRIAGLSDVSLRILLFGPGGTWASTNLAPTLTAPGWQHLSFSLSAADLTYVPGNPIVPGGTGILADTLSAVTKLLVRNDTAIPTAPGTHPPHITATLGLDNITAIPTPGDINFDGQVDGLDLNILGANWQDSPTTFATGDLNGDGVTDGLDLNILGSNWQAGVPAPGPAIPEPASLSLLAISVIAMLRRRRNA
jgi:hypothetical protein